MSPEPWTVISEPREMVSHPWCNIIDYEVRLSNGSRQTRTVHEDRGGVGVAALTDDNQIILLDVPRFPVNRASSWELPGGGLGKSTALEAARRELLEEVGMVARHWRELITVDRFPSFSRNHHTIFLATGLREATDQEKEGIVPDANELINGVIRVPLEEALDQIGRLITDSVTVVGLLLLQVRLAEEGFQP